MTSLEDFLANHSDYKKVIKSSKTFLVPPEVYNSTCTNVNIKYKLYWYNTIDKNPMVTPTITVNPSNLYQQPMRMRSNNNFHVVEKLFQEKELATANAASSLINYKIVNPKALFVTGVSGEGPGPAPPTPPPAPTPPTPPPAPTPSKPAHDPLFGNWYYHYGTVCQAGSAGHYGNILAACPQEIDAYCTGSATSDKSSCQENAAFYLGTGVYPMPGVQDWGNVTRDKPQFKHQIMNFGGWGACPGPEKGSGLYSNSLCNRDGKGGCACEDAGAASPSCVKINKGALPKTSPAFQNTCSTQPNVVWSGDNINSLPKQEYLMSAGYTGISIDIEGVCNSNCTIATPDKIGDAAAMSSQILNAKLKTYDKMTKIITIPGNGVAKENGGMDWMDSETVSLIDFVCLMYYCQIADTECKIGGGTPDDVKKSLSTLWSGPSSKYKFQPSQILLGYTFGTDTGPEDYLSADILKLASGGWTRWAKEGGNLVWSCSYAKTEGQCYGLGANPGSCVWGKNSPSGACSCVDKTGFQGTICGPTPPPAPTPPTPPTPAPSDGCTPPMTCGGGLGWQCKNPGPMCANNSKQCCAPSDLVRL